MARRLLLLGLAAALTIPAGGCIVNSRCQRDYDCSGSERCCAYSSCAASREGSSVTIAAGECFVECTRHQDCWSGGQDNGKQCIDNRCEFRFDQRVAALGFCLPIVNPASGRAGQQLCLSDLRGKVVLLYFGWIT